MGDAPASIDYALIGHITADLTPKGRIAGGTVSYAARTAAAFGFNVGVLTSTAVDEPLAHDFQPFVCEWVNLPAAQTTTYENLYPPTGRVQYVRGVAAPLLPEHIPASFIAAPLVHLAPIADEYDPGALAVCFPQSTILMTLQGLLRAWGDDGRVRFKRWFDADALQQIDIVVFSEEDIIESPQLEPEIAAVVRHLFVTRAEKGGTYYFKGVPTDYDTPHVEVVNQTGAGDVFAATLLGGLHRFDGNFARAIRLAAQLGATAVTRNLLDGTPTPDEVRAALID
ncbi:MAG: PfkB family carbohydrate kinase [Chloroflexota bacterium]|nr:PfkB family carbohydrate kinase [Chloroflexota bacterium]